MVVSRRNTSHEKRTEADAPSVLAACFRVALGETELADGGPISISLPPRGKCTDASGAPLRGFATHERSGGE